MSSKYVELVQLLLTRLERVPVDSFWAHRASGLRGSLLRALDLAETGDPLDSQSLADLVLQAFQILEHAASEKSGPATGVRS